MEGDSEYQLSVTPVDTTAPISPGDLLRVVRETLRAHQTRKARINVALVDDERMAQLNQAYRCEAGPTDVLAFDLRDADCTANGATPGEVDGEIVISVDAAHREAMARRQRPDAEIALYAVHGTLHLLGYDDATPVEAHAMHAQEDRILAAAGWGAVYGGAGA